MARITSLTLATMKSLTLVMWRVTTPRSLKYALAHPMMTLPVMNSELGDYKTWKGGDVGIEKIEALKIKRY
jgi:hypothetical protein